MFEVSSSPKLSRYLATVVWSWLSCYMDDANEYHKDMEKSKFQCPVGVLLQMITAKIMPTWAILMSQEWRCVWFMPYWSGWSSILARSCLRTWTECVYLGPAAYITRVWSLNFRRCTTWQRSFIIIGQSWPIKAFDVTDMIDPPTTIVPVDQSWFVSRRHCSCCSLICAFVLLGGKPTWRSCNRIIPSMMLLRSNWVWLREDSCHLTRTWTFSLLMMRSTCLPSRVLMMIRSRSLWSHLFHSCFYSFALGTVRSLKCGEGFSYLLVFVFFSLCQFVLFDLFLALLDNLARNRNYKFYLACM